MSWCSSSWSTTIFSPTNCTYTIYIVVFSGWCIWWPLWWSRCKILSKSTYYTSIIYVPCFSTSWFYVFSLIFMSLNSICWSLWWSGCNILCGSTSRALLYYIPSFCARTFFIHNCFTEIMSKGWPWHLFPFRPTASCPLAFIFCFFISCAWASTICSNIFWMS